MKNYSCRNLQGVKMEDIKDFNIKNNKYIRYFLSGYYNYYKISLLKSGLNKNQYKMYKLKATLIYLGIPLKYKYFFEVFRPVYLPAEFIVSLLILIYKFIISSFCALGVKREMPVRKILMLALNIPLFRVKQMLKCYPQKEQIEFIKIPFIKSETPYKTYSMYSGIKFEDCRHALILSIYLLFNIFKKFHRYDFLFRSYSSYEFFLSCLYVEHSNESNRFLFVSTNDRWAYLFGNDTKHLNIFIQHGLPGEPIKFKAPHTAYYMNRKQQMHFEKNIFIGKPVESYCRPCLIFNANEKLKNNGKPNLLVICCNNYLDLERKYIHELANINKWNIYIKPHPGFKDHSDYYILQNKYDLVVLDKEDYPRVDKALSYDSALAVEYEDAGVFVLRYSDANFDEEFQALINAK